MSELQYIFVRAYVNLIKDYGVGKKNFLNRVRGMKTVLYFDFMTPTGK